MSRRTLEIHWGGHHRSYVDALNKQLEKNDVLYGFTMEELIRVTYNNGNPLPEFNNAAQVCRVCHSHLSSLQYMVGKF